MRGSLSCRDILDPGLGQNPPAEIGTQKPWCVQVNSPPEDLRQLLFQREEFEARNVSRLELDQHVNVTVRPEIVAKHRSEQCKPANVVAPAKTGKDFLVNHDAAFIQGLPPCRETAFVPSCRARLPHSCPIPYFWPERHRVSMPGFLLRQDFEASQTKNGKPRACRTFSVGGGGGLAARFRQQET